MKKGLFLILICLLLTGCNFLEDDTKSNKKETITTTNDFVEDKGWKESYVELLDSYSCDSDMDGLTCIYHLIDIDDNGVPEMIVKTGEEDEEMIYEVYTYDKKVIKAGKISAANANLFDKKKYMVKQVSSMGVESIYHITLKDGKVDEALEEENTYDDYTDNPYKDFGGALKSYSLSNQQPILDY